MTKWEYLKIDVSRRSRTSIYCSCGKEKDMANMINKAFPGYKLKTLNEYGWGKKWIPLLDLMDFLGNMGWECIGACDVKPEVLIFKRPLQE